MILQIKHYPSNNIIAETGEFTASESFMDIKNLAVKIESPVKLAFTPFNGGSYNYIDYNGNRYYLFIDPTTKDDNKAEKFTYDFNFKGFEYILKLIPFNDIVKAGGNITYTNGGIVSFFGGSATIAQFLNANLEQYFGDKTTWQVVEDFSDAFEPTMYPDQYFSFINQNCWDVVNSIKDVLGVNYFIDTPIGGLARIRITDKTNTLPYVFRQGDGDGLYSIGKTISNEDELLTVIRPSGGNRNIRPGYKKSSKPIDDSRYSPYLLLPDVDGFLQYEIRNEEAIKKYGVRAKSVSDPFQGIFPSIQNATLGDVYGVPLPSNGNDGVSLIGLNASDRIDRIVASDFDAESKFFTIYVTDIGFDLEKKQSGKYVYYSPEDAVISMRTGLYAGQDFKIQQGKATKLDSNHAQYSKGARYGIVLERNEDGTDIEGNPMLVPTEALSAGNFFAILGIYPPDVYYTIAESRLKIAASEWLKRYSVPQYTIPIDIAVSYFVEYPDEFKDFRAGNRLKVWGEDIDVNIESFTIQSYSLQYTKDNSYPKYSVTLSEVKEMGLTDRLNAMSNASSQAKSEQKYLGGGTGGGGTGIPEIDVTDKRYLRKDVPDAAGGLIDFQEGLNSHRKSIHEEGIQIGKRFVTGYIGGVGGYFDSAANGEIESLKIRTSLEVPTITFNNIDVISGDQVSSFSFGTIKEVDTESKTITLDLLEDERGTPHVNDICRGVFHNIEGNNLGEESEDENGFVNYAGFSTSYFTPIQIISNEPGLFVFRYALKADTTIHPMVGMNFFAYGNFTDTRRQTITYTTRTYTRRLKNMNTWIINPDRNIGMQDGLLEGLNIGGMEMHGYGTYSENNYFTGTQIQFTPEQESDLAGKDAYNVVLSTYESAIVVDSLEDIGDLSELANVYTNGNQVQTEDKDVVTTLYRLNTLIQASKGDKPLFYSDVYQEGGYTVTLNNIGCVASISSGIVNVTSITDPNECRVEITVNCEGNVIFEKVFNLSVIVNGSSNVVADLDNEMTAVACNEDGSVLFGLPLSTNVRMWYGYDELEITEVTMDIPSGVTAGYDMTNGVKVTVTDITKDAADVLEIGINVTAVHLGKTYTRKVLFTINKVRQGENALLYQVLPSVSAIKKKNDGTLLPSTVSCILTKRDGKTDWSSESVMPDGYSMKYAIDEGAENPYTIESVIPTSNVSTSIGFMLYYGVTLIDKETIPVIDDGTDGKSNVIADIDNEMSAVACAQDGTVLFGLPLSTNVSMWYGTEELTINKVVINAPSGVTANYSITKGAKITVTGITQAAADTLNIEIVITGTFNSLSYTRTLVFTVSKVKQGENAVLYELLPSVTSVKRNKYGSTSPSTVYSGLTKIDGSSGVSSISSIPSGYSMKYSIDNGTSYSYSINSTISTTSASLNITFYLYYGGIIIDRETIPIVIDGTDGSNGSNGSNGSDGSDATRYWLISSVDQIGVSLAGYLDPSSFMVYSKYQTGTGGIYDNSSYYIILFRTNNKASWSYVTNTRGSSLTVTPSASYKYYRVCLATAYTTSVTSSYIIDSKDISIVEDGRTGSMPRFRGVYNSSETYVWNDEYRDIVNTVSGSSYSTYQVANFGQSFSGVTPPNSSYWQAASQFKFVAMDTALIDNGKLGGFTFNNYAFQSQDTTSGVSNLILNSKTGYLKCNNAEITGTITSTNGRIGGFTMTNDFLNSVATVGGTSNEPMMSIGSSGVRYKSLTLNTVSAIGSTVFSTSSGYICPLYSRNLSSSGGLTGNGSALKLEVGNSRFTSAFQRWIECGQVEGWGAGFTVEARYFGDANEMNRTVINILRLTSKQQIESKFESSPVWRRVVWEEKTGYLAYEF